MLVCAALLAALDRIEVGADHLDPVGLEAGAAIFEMCLYLDPLGLAKHDIPADPDRGQIPWRLAVFVEIRPEDH